MKQNLAACTKECECLRIEGQEKIDFVGVMFANAV